MLTEGSVEDSLVITDTVLFSEAVAVADMTVEASEVVNIFADEDVVNSVEMTEEVEIEGSVKV